MNVENFKIYAVYAFAFVYLGILAFAFLGTDPPRITSGDFFSQAALLMAGIGLYNARSPRD